jgi:poly(A) RNA polymerase GLD2
MANAVKEWLSGLGLGRYAEAFVDNGYDDMAICHDLSEEDIDAIGVEPAEDRHLILQESKKLQEKGEEKAGPIYFELEAEKTVRIPRMKLKIMILEEMKKDKVKLDEEPYSNTDGTPGESLDDLIEVYALQFNTDEEDVRSCIEALRESAVSCHSSVSSEQSLSPVQKEQPKRPVPSKKPGDYKPTTEQKKPPPKPAAPPVVGASSTEKAKQPPAKPKRTKPSENVGQYINFNEVSSMMSSQSEQEKIPTVEDKQPKAAPRKSLFEDGNTRIPPQKPKSRPLMSRFSPKPEDTAKKEDSPKPEDTAKKEGSPKPEDTGKKKGHSPKPENTGKKEDSEDKLEAGAGHSGISDGEEPSATSQEHEGTPDITHSESKLSAVRMSVSKGFQGLKAKLKKRKPTSSQSLSVSATPSPAATPPPLTANPVFDVGGLTAKDITMSNEDRMKLMMMVKEGKCTVEEAWSQIESYEEERKTKEEITIRKAETEEEMNQEEQLVEIQEAKREPLPKPIRPHAQPSAAPRASSVEKEKPEVSKDEKKEGTVTQAGQPVARPRRRNKPVKPSQLEISETKQSGSDTTNNKPIGGEAEARKGPESKMTVNDMTSKKAMSSGVMFGVQLPQAPAPVEAKVDENEGEQETTEFEQGDKGDETAGKPGKKGFLKNILGIKKKDKIKKEQKAESPRGHATSAAADEKEVKVCLPNS